MTPEQQLATKGRKLLNVDENFTIAYPRRKHAKEETVFLNTSNTKTIEVSADGLNKTTIEPNGIAKVPYKHQNFFYKVVSDSSSTGNSYLDDLRKQKEQK